MKKKIFIVCCLALTVLGIGAIYFINNVDSHIENTVFFELLTTITAVFGVWSLISQRDKEKVLDEAKFIFELNKQYTTNEKYQGLLNLLEYGSPDTFPSDIADIIAQYFDFFEPIYILAKKDILNIKLIDDLFCFRFFAVVNNSYVQDKVLTPHKEYYANIVKLHYIWKKYRLSKKINRDIPFISSDLSLVSWYNDSCQINNGFHRKRDVKINKIKIREANMQDAKSITNLYYQLLGQYTINSDIGEQINVIKKDDKNHILVAIIDKKIVGTVQCAIIQSIAYNGRPNMTIDYFVVDKDYRNMGIGTLLYKKVDEIAEKNNVKSIILVSSNYLKSAHKFYKKMGFNSLVKGFRMDNR